MLEKRRGIYNTYMKLLVEIPYSVQEKRRRKNMDIMTRN